MPEIPEICEFEVAADQFLLTTKTNGEHIEISGLSLSQDAVASLSWLINSNQQLKIEIKLVT